MAVWDSNQKRVKDYVSAEFGSAEAFLEEYANPFLVVLYTEQEHDNEQNDGYFTSVIVPSMLQHQAALAKGLYIDPEATVFPVVKRETVSPYSAMVTLGRNPNCDIVLPIKDISKFHCYIAVDPRQESSYFIADAGSRNGTQLNDDLLTPRQQEPVKTGDMITIGRSVTFRFYLPEDLWTRILRK